MFFQPTMCLAGNGVGVLFYIFFYQRPKKKKPDRWRDTPVDFVISKPNIHMTSLKCKSTFITFFFASILGGS